MPSIVILIVMVLGLVLIGLAGFGVPPPDPPRRHNFGWIGLALCVLAWLLANGGALLHG